MVTMAGQAEMRFHADISLSEAAASHHIFPAAASAEFNVFLRLLEKNVGPMAVQNTTVTIYDLIRNSKESDPVHGSAVDAIRAVIATLDRKISDQINLILHQETFQKLEGTWRGLYYLVFNSPIQKDIKLRILNISHKEIQRSLKKYPGITWDQCPLFKLIYENEFGTAGGEPFGCLIGDYYFDETPVNINILSGIAKIAAAAHVPFIAAAAPSIMNMESWQELTNPRDYDRIFSAPEYLMWRSFRNNDNSRYIALTMPRVLARVPYGICTVPVNGFDFEEDVGAGVKNNYCWMNAAYIMGSNVIRAYSKYGWCVRICGADAGGRAENLPIETYPSELGLGISKCPLETAITDRREIELSRNGLLPLCSWKNSLSVVFQSGQTVYQPKEYQTAEASFNDDLSSKLPCVFAVSRFAHYLKCILRDKLGTFNSSAKLQQWLNDWIANYISGDPEASDEMKAKYPLAEAVVKVVPQQDKPGYFQVNFYLRPHYQIDGLTASVKLSAMVPERMKS